MAMGRHDVVDDFEDDPEEPEESDMDSDEGDDEAETVECPHCGRDVYEQAEKCPFCRGYLSREDARKSGKPRWVIATTLVLLLVIFYAWVKWGF